MRLLACIVGFRWRELDWSVSVDVRSVRDLSSPDCRLRSLTVLACQRGDQPHTAWRDEIRGRQDYEGLEWHARAALIEGLDLIFDAERSGEVFAHPALEN